MSALPLFLPDWPSLCQSPLPWRQPMTLLWLCLGAPLLQEWALRAGLQEYLLRRAVARLGPAGDERRRERLLSVMLPALVFTLLQLGHGWLALQLALPVALLIGLVYLHTRDWFACACAHLAANAFAWLSCFPPPLP
ncbi:JDVT-CTERM system glutamic-type intramembrane protease [Ideonella sp. DXS22W]|uniref:JDVT-CTERM system glutamic-type intramembrane protease n=1 Tax=Pseudaquabacterium inlustre TaxID=2984192 RepID=A0ABU9CBF0_9BURK